MTAREHIIEYLTQAGDYIHSGNIHNYVIGKGYFRNSSESVLSKLVSSGQVLRKGKATAVYCKLNPDYVPVKTSGMQAENREKPTSVNVVFDEYRENSQVYQFDKYLRTVRQRNATELVRA